MTSVNVSIQGVDAVGRVGPNISLELESDGGILTELGSLLILEQAEDTFVVLSPNISVAGVSAIGQLGNVEVIGTANIYPEGVQAVGIISPVLVWGQVDDGQNPDWQAVGGFQSANWQDILDTQDPEWTNIAA